MKIIWFVCRQFAREYTSGSELKKCPINIMRPREKRASRRENELAHGQSNQMPEKVDVGRHIYITRVENRYSGGVEGGSGGGAKRED